MLSTPQFMQTPVPPIPIFHVLHVVTTQVLPLKLTDSCECRTSNYGIYAQVRGKKSWCSQPEARGLQSEFTLPGLARKDSSEIPRGSLRAPKWRQRQRKPRLG